MKPHDPNHPYVRRLVGCGHGVLFKDYCKDCEIVGLHEEHKRAAKTIARVRDRLRVLGAARAAEPDLLAALHEAYRPLDRTQEWTPEHSRVYPKKAATIINAARLLSLAASQTPPTGTSQEGGEACVAFVHSVIATLERSQSAGLHLDSDKRQILSDAHAALAKGAG